MEKFKICPFCGQRNAPNAFDCDNCDMDISTIRVVDEETIEISEESVDTQSATTTESERVRICEECGFRNPANARKCQQCGEDISDILPTEVATSERIHYILSSIDGEYAYPIPAGKTEVGREAAMSDYLLKKSFVSRRHAQLNLENGKIMIKNYSKTNYTYINNTKITDEVVELHDGDIVGLGGNEKDGKRQDEAAYFMMRIGSCI